LFKNHFVTFSGFGGLFTWLLDASQRSKTNNTSEKPYFIRAIKLSCEVLRCWRLLFTDWIHVGMIIDTCVRDQLLYNLCFHAKLQDRSTYWRTIWKREVATGKRSVVVDIDFSDLFDLSKQKLVTWNSYLIFLV